MRPFKDEYPALAEALRHLHQLDQGPALGSLIVTAALYPSMNPDDLSCGNDPSEEPDRSLRQFARLYEAIDLRLRLIGRPRE